MTRIKLPYGRGVLSTDIPTKRIRGIFEPKYCQGKDQPAEAVTGESAFVEEALAVPIASSRLQELARGKRRIVIISSDHTRPVPSRITMPLLLAEIRRGNPNAEITILVATGFHRATTGEELRERFGEEVIKMARVVVHDCSDQKNLVYLGKLPSGGDLVLNRLAVEADLLTAEGFIEPHLFAGFSGGRKSVLPGIASRDTIMANHCAGFIAHPHCRAGILDDNPIHKDMLYAAQAARLAFILNVVLDSGKRIIKAFAGHYNEAHLQGCRYVQDLSGVKAASADIVITTNGGYPLDQNVYQAVKCMTAAEAICKEKGVIIAVSQCSDGHGGTDFYETFVNAARVEDIMRDIVARPADKTVADQWQSQLLARILLKYNVIMVTDAPREMIEKMKMKWAPSVQEALKMAENILGNAQATITVIPDGVAVIVGR